VAALVAVVDIDNFQFQYDDDEVVFPDETISCDHSLGCCGDYWCPVGHHGCGCGWDGEA
jgi:hypothetical protein